MFLSRYCEQHNEKICLSCQLCILRSEEHTSELQSHVNLVCRLLLEKKNRELLTLPVRTPGGRAANETAVLPAFARADADLGILRIRSCVGLHVLGRSIVQRDTLTVY